MVRSERCHALSGPAIAMAGDELIPVEDAGNEIVVGDEREMADGGDDIGRGAVALTFPTARQAQFGMNAAHPVDDEDDLCGLGIDIGNHLADQRANDLLLDPRVRRRGGPHGPEITGQGLEGERCE